MFTLFIQEQEQTTSKPKDKGDKVIVYFLTVSPFGIR